MAGHQRDISIGACALLLNTMVGAIQLPNTTYLPSDFSASAIKTIVERLGLIYQSYKLTTVDGYILNLNRIINPDKMNATDKGVPVLFVNGLLLHSEAWLLHTRPELNLPIAYLLEGYDVWLGDQRGTLRSTDHVTLNTNHWAFWNFSFHETGVYDLPAFIDFILTKTGHPKLVYSGVSLGGTFYYVMCTERPEYQEKLYGGILWQPAGEAPSLSSDSLRMVLRLMLGEKLLGLAWSVGIGQVPPISALFRTGVYGTCSMTRFTPADFATLSLGSGCKWETQICMQLASAVGGTSSKTILHIIQLFMNGGIFSQYDYGFLLNYIRYGHKSPPIYNISKLRVFTAIYSSDTDMYAPTRVILPFSKKFSGPKYTCNIKGVCHGFAHLDPRAGPSVLDSIEVLNSITGRTSSDKALSGRCAVPAP